MPNRRGIKGERGRRLLRSRGEKLERTFAHCYLENEARKGAPGEQLLELQERRERLTRRTALIVLSLEPTRAASWTA